MSGSQLDAGFDMATPNNVEFSAFYKRSFAFHTIKNRLPVIVTQLIDTLVRSKHEIAQEFGDKASEELKEIIGEISQLKYEIQTNKSLRLLAGQEEDVEICNSLLRQRQELEGDVTFFNTNFLFAECYAYRRLKEIFAKRNLLKNYDYFTKSKRESFNSGLILMVQFSKFLLQLVKDDSTVNSKEDLTKLLKLNLWGNKCDLSMSLGKVVDHQQLFAVEQFEPYVLCDDSLEVFEAISQGSSCKTIDIINDNVGYELFSDFALADYLITKKFAQKIRFYVKTMPWFLSDVMPHDITWTLQEFCNSSEDSLRKIGLRWTNYLEQGVWTVEKFDFWTLPVDFSQMKTYDSKLYSQLSESFLAIFKGDLNYRKLFGEKNWNPYTSLEVALQGFNPTRILTLRTLKSEGICGLKRQGIVEETEESHEDWRVSGEFGVIQFCNKI